MLEDITTYMQGVGEKARRASVFIANADTNTKNQTLFAISEILDQSRSILKEANNKDLYLGKEQKLSPALLDRLTLTDSRIDCMIDGIKKIIQLPDLVGVINNLRYLPSGMQLGQMRVPLGVVGVIYESRPNVTIDAAGLCIKSGNAAILRGGSEAIHSNGAIANCVEQAMRQTGLSTDIIQVINTTDRAAVSALLTMEKYVDVIIPRGGKSLIARVSKESKIPIIKHLDGICHIYVDKEADLNKAHDIALNAKTQRYGVCNAMETLLVHEDIAHYFLPSIYKSYSSKNVEVRGCAATLEILNGIVPANEEDWMTEYLAPIISIKIVKDVKEAVVHINHYGSHHTDAIITESYTRSRYFLKAVDSGSVMINASTRLADGFEYGMGAEIGISNDKLHARGPVGLEGLTSQKFVVFGDGQIKH